MMKQESLLSKEPLITTLNKKIYNQIIWWDTRTDGILNPDNLPTGVAILGWVDDEGYNLTLILTKGEQVLKFPAHLSARKRFKQIFLK